MSKKIVLTDGQTGYEVIGDYIQRYWENVCCTTVLVTIFSSCNGREYDRKSIIASPEFPDMALEYDYDWWEGEKYIILSGIVDIHDIVVEGGIFEPLEEAKTKLLSSDVAPVRRGKWVKGDFKFAEMSCSLCGFAYYGEHDVECMSNFCPECGAKMDIENSENEIN